MKHKQLKSSAKSDSEEKEIFRIGPCNSAILDILSIMSSNLAYRDRERQRKRESRRQASQAQRERERQRARGRRQNCSDEQWEREQERSTERGRSFTDEQLDNERD